MKPVIFIDGKEGTTGLQIYERLAGRDDIELLLIDEEKRKDPAERAKCMDKADLVFLCLPDAAAKESVSMIQDPDTRVIDASTAHRTAAGWTYGFSELTGQKKAIQQARLVANPGCYATGFVSLVRPLVEKGILPADAQVTCHALSGYTGAGKKGIAQYEDAQRDGELDSPRHYAVSLSHKHLPEMAKISGLEHEPLFMPIICDFPQGMLVTVPLWVKSLSGKYTIADLRKVYEEYYADSALISLRPEDAPSCGFIGSNNLAGKDTLQIFVNGNEEQLMLSARLDNLGKGASGAAIQNMNIMLGFEETKGLFL